MSPPKLVDPHEIIALMIFLVLFMVHSLHPAVSKKTNSLKRPKGINSFKDENSIRSRIVTASKNVERAGPFGGLSFEDQTRTTILRYIDNQERPNHQIDACDAHASDLSATGLKPSAELRVIDRRL